MTILWDEGDIHDRSKVVRAYPAEHPEVETERFPSYAPETIPDEMVWQHVKYSRLANFAPEDTDELGPEMIREFLRLEESHDLLSSFIRHAGIPIRLRKLSR
jgi:hypothetical protein